MFPFRHRLFGYTYFRNFHNFIFSILYYRHIFNMLVFISGIGDPSEKETIEQLQKELRESRDHFEIDQREIEQAYRLEIADIEEGHDREKEHLLQHIQREKVWTYTIL